MNQSCNHKVEYEVIETNVVTQKAGWLYLLLFFFMWQLVFSSSFNLLYTEGEKEGSGSISSSFKGHEIFGIRAFGRSFDGQLQEAEPILHGVRTENPQFVHVACNERWKKRNTILKILTSILTNRWINFYFTTCYLLENEITFHDISEEYSTGMVGTVMLFDCPSSDGDRLEGTSAEVGPISSNHQIRKPIIK